MYAGDASNTAPTPTLMANLISGLRNFSKNFQSRYFNRPRMLSGLRGDSWCFGIITGRTEGLRERSIGQMHLRRHRPLRLQNLSQPHSLGGLEVLYFLRLPKTFITSKTLCANSSSENEKYVMLAATWSLCTFDRCKFKWCSYKSFRAATREAR